MRQPGGGAYTRRFATVILLLRGDGHLGPIAVIFRGKGRVSKQEKKAYHRDITVLWQAKAWNDSATQLLYDDMVLLPALKKAGVGEGNPPIEALVFQDNLNAHRFVFVFVVLCVCVFVCLCVCVCL